MKTRPIGTGRARITLLLLLASLAVLALVVAQPAGATVGNKVLILEETVTGGTSSIEAQEAIADGMTVEVVNNATWASMSAAQFASYRAIILGDPTCRSITPAVNTAAANAKTWGPVINGNIVIIGSDPVFHAGQGGSTVTQRTVDFAVSSTGKTGAYIALSCYYHGTAPGTPVPLLDGIGSGGFTATGVGCYDNAHIVADSPALAGITDSTLSGWSCSVHEAFESWPGALVPLAIAKDFSSSYTASDGTQGPPYILAGGNIQSFPLSLSPHSGTAVPGSSYTVTAQLLDGVTRAPIVGAKMGFAVLSGPNAGTGGTCNPNNCRTNSSGQVSFTYTSKGATGADTIQTYYDANENGKADPGEAQTIAGVTWVAPKGLYVALGDSFSAGEGNPPYLSGTDSKGYDRCHRSTFGYPFDVNLDDGFYAPNFSFHACSGAVIRDFASANAGNHEPAQLSWLRSAGTRTKLVTLSVGGNDAYFAKVIQACFEATFLNFSCQNVWNGAMVGAIRLMSTNTPSNPLSLAQLYKRVAADAPNAQIIVVGYPRFFPPSPGFFCSTGAGPTYWDKGQMSWLNEKVKEGDNAISSAVAATGNSRIHYVAGSYDAFNGHERCTHEPYYNGIIGSLDENVSVGSFHPNMKGQRRLAQLVEVIYHP